MLFSSEKAAAAVLILGSLFTTGCGMTATDYGHVTGVVTINGAPVEGASVTFAPVEGGRTAIATTAEDGSYELNYTPGVKGAKVGENTVLISTYVEPTRDDNNRITDPGVPERFPPQYSRSGDIVVEVEPGENTFNFEVQAEQDKYPAR